MTVKVHDPNFEPSHRGRPASVDIAHLVHAMQDNPGLWVEQTMSMNEANATIRALKRWSKTLSVPDAVALATKKYGEHKTVYCRLSLD